ncbi:hypothetical protein VTH06DRAFT_3348 [Thermothelomyces fergusii]
MVLCIAPHVGLDNFTRALLVVRSPCQPSRSPYTPHQTPEPMIIPFSSFQTANAELNMATAFPIMLNAVETVRIFFLPTNAELRMAHLGYRLCHPFSNTARRPPKMLNDVEKNPEKHRTIVT